MPKEENYKCQFCEKESPKSKWEELEDRCPECHAKYDPMLAQEGDD